MESLRSVLAYAGVPSAMEIRKTEIDRYALSRRSSLAASWTTGYTNIDRNRISVGQPWSNEGMSGMHAFMPRGHAGQIDRLKFYKYNPAGAQDTTTKAFYQTRCPL